MRYHLHLLAHGLARTGLAARVPVPVLVSRLRNGLRATLNTPERVEPEA